jgi:uncharacterized protein involved in exopolysaccharide biosynthesis
MQQNNCIEEDEIDLRELFQTIKDGKYLIIAITTIVVLFTFVYVLKLPNVYKSEAILIPTEQEGGSALGGLGGLAAMAGVSIGGASSMTPDVAFNSLLNNYDFMRNFILRNGIYDYYSRDDYDKNYVFALGMNGIYNIFKSDKSAIKVNKDDEIYNLTKKLQKQFSISADKKSGLITVSFMDSDRFYAPKIVNMFLKDASEYLVQNSLKNINSRLKYFQTEMSRVDGFELRQSLSQIISKILQEKVMMKSKQYYQCDLLTAAQVPYIKDKAKPKRALILVVSFITSIILGIFLVFFLNFLKQERVE